MDFKKGDSAIYVAHSKNVERGSLVKCIQLDTHQDPPLIQVEADKGQGGRRVWCNPKHLLPIEKYTPPPAPVRSKSSLFLGGKELMKILGVPKDAEVVVMVPGGGDWSNTELDLINDSKIEIRWTNETES